MTTLASLIILCTVAIGILIAVILVNRRERRARRAEQSLKFLQFRFNALDEMAVTVAHAVNSPLIAKHLYDETVRLLETMHKLDPHAEVLKPLAERVQRRAAEFGQAGNSGPGDRLPDNAAQTARTQQALQETERVLKQRHQRGVLSAEELAQCNAALARARSAMAGVPARDRPLH